MKILTGENIVSVLSEMPPDPSTPDADDYSVTYIQEWIAKFNGTDEDCEPYTELTLKDLLDVFTSNKTMGRTRVLSAADTLALVYMFPIVLVFTALLMYLFIKINVRLNTTHQIDQFCLAYMRKTVARMLSYDKGGRLLPQPSMWIDMDDEPCDAPNCRRNEKQCECPLLPKAGRMKLVVTAGRHDQTSTAPPTENKDYGM